MQFVDASRLDASSAAKPVYWGATQTYQQQHTPWDHKVSDPKLGIGPRPVRATNTADLRLGWPPYSPRSLAQNVSPRPTLGASVLLQRSNPPLVCPLRGPPSSLIVSPQPHIAHAGQVPRAFLAQRHTELGCRLEGKIGPGSHSAHGQAYLA